MKLPAAKQWYIFLPTGKPIGSGRIFFQRLKPLVPEKIGNPTTKAVGS
jgi:hypothetical protein